MIKYFRTYKQKYFDCRRGKHIYYGVSKGTACFTCNWKDI